MRWYSIKAEADDSVEVLIDDIIGEYGWGDGISARNLIRDLQQHRNKKLKVRLNSIGGAVQDGITIHNYLKGRGNVDVVIDGYACSIASIIALAGDKVTMAKNSLIMIHDVRGAVFAEGTAEQIREEAEQYASVAEKINETLVSTYVDETGNSEKQIRAWMKEEKWFTAEEAKEFGFIDDIAGATTLKNLTNHVSLSRFRRVPESLGGKPAAQQKTKENPMEKLLAALVAAGLLPSAKLDDAEAADIFKAEWKKREDVRTANETTITTLENAAKTQKRKEAEGFVNAAAKNCRIKDDAALKGRWVEAYLKDEEGTKAMLEGVEAKAPQKGAAPVPDDDGGDDTDESKLRAQLAKETDPAKRGLIARQLREARGHKDIFA